MGGVKKSKKDGTVWVRRMRRVRFVSVLNERLSVCAYMRLVRGTRTFVALFLDLYGFSEIFILLPLDLSACCTLV